MAEKTGAGATSNPTPGERVRDGDASPEATWGANENRKQQWADKHGDAARKAAEKANEEK